MKGGTRTLAAVMWMTGTLTSFIAMMTAARELTASMSVFEILAFRSAIALIIVMPFVVRLGAAHFRTRRPGFHAIRNVVHFTAQAAWVYGIGHLPLAEVTALEFTTPLWTALMAILLIGENINRHRAVAIGLGLAGVLIILRPGAAAISPAALVVLGAAFCYAASAVMVKVLTRSDSALMIVFYMQLIQLPLGLVPALFDWTQPGWADAPWLIVLGITALSAHYCLARALTLGDATIVAPIDFLRLPGIAIVGFLVYAETLEIWVALGALLIAGGNYYSIYCERRLEQARQAP